MYITARFLSHSLVAVPLICIYEISIALSKIVSKRKRKEKKKSIRKVPRYKGTFLLLYSSYKRIQYKEEKIIESPKFRQTLRFYKFILNVLSNIRITSPRLIGYVGWGMD